MSDEKKKKLVIIIGDYSAGPAEYAVDSGSFQELVSSDSADARVLRRMIEQDPSITDIAFFPSSRQFSPNAAGAVLDEALQWGFKLLKNGTYDIVDAKLNVAPGLKNLKGSTVKENGHHLNGKENSNENREAFAAGELIDAESGHRIHVGITNAFYEGEGHTLGYVSERIASGEYTSPNGIRVVDGKRVKQLIKDFGQFRSLALLVEMEANAGNLTFTGDDLFNVAREQHDILKNSKAGHEKLAADVERAKAILANTSFIPNIHGDPTLGFVTVISEADKPQLEGKLTQLAESEYKGQFITGMGYDGNEGSGAKETISRLPREQQRNYREARQAHLAATLANEHEGTTGLGTYTIIIDSQDSTPNDKNKLDVELNNGAHIITSNPRLLALTIQSIKSINGLAVDDERNATILADAKKFRNHLESTAIENDGYLNIKHGATFDQRLQQVDALLVKEYGNSNIPEDKAVELTVVATTHNVQQEFKVYYTPKSIGGFGVWGHGKLSSGSTSLDTTKKQAEFFKAGGKSAGHLCTSIPGVTTFKFTKAKLVELDKLKTPGTTISLDDNGEPQRRVRHRNSNGKWGKWLEVDTETAYHDVHKNYVADLFQNESIRRLSNNAYDHRGHMHGYCI